MREGGTPKGRGKGDGGKGYQDYKGKGKGDYFKGYQAKGGDYHKGYQAKGAQDKGKGKGKYGGKSQMRCFSCQGLGHRAADCPQRAVSGVWETEEEYDEDVREVGGVWMVANVTEETWREVKAKKKMSDMEEKVVMKSN